MESKKPFIITVIVLVLIILGLGGYIALDIYVLKKNEVNTLTVINDVSVNLNTLLEVEDTLNRLDSAFNTIETDYSGYIYKRKLEISNFDQGAALYAAMYSDLQKAGSVQYLSASIVKNNFEKMFGKNLKFSAEKVKSGQGFEISYDTRYNVYVYTLPLNKSVYNSGYVTTTTKTALTEDSIIVTRKLYFIDYVIDPVTTAATSANIYKDSTKSQLIGEVSLNNTSVDEDEVIGKYGSKLYTFEYTFKENTIDDYTLYKIERK